MATSVRDLPSASEREEEIVARLLEGTPALFFDYDGTLTPIVDDPDDAVLSPGMRDALERVARRCPVAIVSGRDLDDVRGKVGIDDIHYAGSHGFDILQPDGTRHRRGTEHREALERAAEALEDGLGPIEGASVERKGFAVAVHFRRLKDPEQADRVEEVVDRVSADEPTLRKTDGKKIFELRPDVDWDKGRALRLVLDLLTDEGTDGGEGADSGASRYVPLYIGDDVTDEDGFRALPERGVGIVVEEEEDRETAAGYSLTGPAAVERFLHALADRMEAASSARPAV